MSQPGQTCLPCLKSSLFILNWRNYNLFFISWIHMKSKPSQSCPLPKAFSAVQCGFLAHRGTLNCQFSTEQHSTGTPGRSPTFIVVWVTLPTCCCYFSHNLFPDNMLFPRDICHVKQLLSDCSCPATHVATRCRDPVGILLALLHDVLLWVLHTAPTTETGQFIFILLFPTSRPNTDEADCIFSVFKKNTRSFFRVLRELLYF